MNRFATLAVSALAFAACHGIASAEVLYQTTWTFSSARFSDYGTNDQTGFRTYDSFTVANDAGINKVSWRGLYLDLAAPLPAPAPTPDAVSWNIAFYSDLSGAPGSLLSVTSFAAAAVNSQLIQTGTFNVNNASYNVEVYDYSVSLPVAVAVSAGTPYWVSIFAYSDVFSPGFALLGGSGGDGLSYQHTLGAGESVVGSLSIGADRAIALEGFETPLPATFIPVATVLAGAALLRRRMRRTA